MESRGAMKLRAGLGIGVIVAFLTALALASAPQIHERLHPNAQHECAATIIASGKCEHAAPPASVPCCADIPVAPALVPRVLAPINPDIRSSILEHAPPSAS